MKNTTRTPDEIAYFAAQAAYSEAFDAKAAADLAAARAAN